MKTNPVRAKLKRGEASFGTWLTLPDPTSARGVAVELGTTPARVLYVGDSGVDMQTAVAAGMAPLGVSWGFRPVEELVAEGAWAVIDRPEELLPYLDREYVPKL